MMKKITLYIILAMLGSVYAWADIPIYERLALSSLYSHTDGHNWFNNENWQGPAGTECTWYGVVCDDEGDHVIELNLRDNNLTGTLPDTLRHLVELKRLDLWINHLSGPIPPELGQLTALTYLDLGDNQLSGPLPPELGNLAALELFWLNDNALTGPLPDTFANLMALRNVGLCGNELDGTLPAWLGDLVQLESLYLHMNCFDGPIPSQLGHLTQLKNLWLSENDLTGAVPPELGNLNSLENLHLEYNQLADTIPPDLGQLGNLLVLHVANNQLTGPIPTQLGQLENLGLLGLGGNELTGPIPTQLGQLLNLYNLCLAGNDLSGSIPPQLGNLGQLVNLSLDDNRLDGPIPPELGDLASLTSLNLGANLLTGPIPPELGQLGNLTWLSVAYNQLTGSIPPELGNLSRLEYLNFNDNLLDGALPPELGSLTNLRELYGAGNDLQGSLPSQLGQLSNLTHLSLSMNSLSGPLPFELGNLVLLEYLWLDNNQFTDRIPSALGNLSRLRELGLWNNQLSGPIPPELGNLPTLTGLDLGMNRLDGAIPPDLGDLAALTGLNLGANQLTGPIPDRLGELPALVYLNLIENQLAGAIPPALGNLAQLEELHLWKNQLSGPIPPELGDIGSLQCLDISANELTGDIPAALGELRSLLSMCLADNALTGEIPDSFRHLENLEYLNLNDNDLTGGFPGHLSQLPRLQSLELSWNRLSGPIPAAVGDMTALLGLTLMGNQFEGSLPPELFTLTGLETLCLNGNPIGGPIPPEFAQMTGLQCLNLSHCQFSGQIPSELGQLGQLLDLHLYANNLTGAIPSELSNLSHLEYLTMDRNQLSGPLPPELGDLASLRSLRGHHNNLEGSIPSELSRLGNLEYLYLQNNNLTGTIPCELGTLSNLKVLHLRQNHLTGGIPSQLGNLSRLEYLLLHHNHLTGPIPPEIGNLTNLEFLWLSANMLEGEIPASITNLVSLCPWNYPEIGYGGLFLDANALYSTDPVVHDFCNLNSWDGAYTRWQTTAPADLTAADVMPTSVLLTWEPGHHDEEAPEGGYEILAGESPTGPFTVIRTIPDPTTTAYRLCLLPNQTVHLALRSWVGPYYWNANRVTSGMSEVLTVTTGTPETLVDVHFNPEQTGSIDPDSPSQVVPATWLHVALHPDSFPNASPADPALIWLVLPDGAYLSQTLATGGPDTASPLPAAGETVSDLALTEYAIDARGRVKALGPASGVTEIGPHAVQLFRYVAGEAVIQIRLNESTTGWTPTQGGDFIGFTIGIGGGVWPSTAESNWGAAGVRAQTGTLFYLDLRLYAFAVDDPMLPLRFSTTTQFAGQGLSTGFSPETVPLFRLAGGEPDAAKANSTLNAAVTDFALADLDGDGTDDLVVVDQPRQMLLWRLGRTDGTFGNGAERFLPGWLPRTVDAADLTADGRPDVLVGCAGGELLFFAWEDLFGPGAAKVLRPRWCKDLAAAPADAVLRDINQDGHRDYLFTSEETGEMTIRFGAGFDTAVSYPAGGAPRALCCGDFDGNLAPDIAVADHLNHALTVFHNSGEGNLTAVPVPGIGDGPVDIGAADFNHDGRCDLAVALAGAKALRIVFSDAAGGFQPGDGQSLFFQHEPSALLVDNLDGRFWPDVLVAFADDSRLAMCISDESGTIHYAFSLDTIADVVVDPVTGARLAEDDILSVAGGTGSGGVSRRDGVAAVADYGYQVLHLPRSRDISFSVVNLGENDLLLNLDLYHTDATAWPDGLTEMSARHTVNAADTIPPGRQFARYPADLLGAEAEQTNAWVRGFTAGGQVRGLWLVNSRSGEFYLDGARMPDAWQTVADFVLPVVLSGEDEFTEVYLMNPSRATAEVVLSLIAADGTEKGRHRFRLHEHARTRFPVASLFPGAETGDYVRGRSDRPVLAVEIFGTPAAVACLEAMPADTPAETLYAAHVAVGDLGVEYTSVLHLVNPTGSLQSLAIGLFDDLGDRIADTVIDLESGTARRENLASLFGLTEPTTGFLSVVPSGSGGILGAITFGPAGGGAFYSGLPLQRAEHNRFILGHIANGRLGDIGYFTGLAVVNPDTDTLNSVDVTITAYDQDGLPRASFTTELGGQDPGEATPPPRRVVALLHQLMPDLRDMFGGYLVVETREYSGHLLVFALFGDQAGQFLSAIPAAPLPSSPYETAGDRTGAR
ncbi:MAG: VCBS repeat-containing protein [Acidobacteria bacterium]|nr:VCBS repeat-containing protein [Acidobacteriota bacterium]